MPFVLALLLALLRSPAARTYLAKRRLVNGTVE